MKNLNTAVDESETTLAEGNKKISMYYIMQGSTPRILQTSKPEHWNKQCTLEVHPIGLLGFFPINALSKQKRAMCCAMRKPRELHFK